jgi:hypothetical protein
MNQKLLNELQAYIAGLKATAPADQHIRATRALAELSGVLETIDPTDAFLEAVSRGAGLGNTDSISTATSDAFTDAVRKGADFVAGKK